MAGQLKTLGDAPSTAARQLQLVGRLSRFLQQWGLAASELSAEVVDEFSGTFMHIADRLGRP
jgi:hypothetical protein